jgi:hypothetical protein
VNPIDAGYALLIQQKTKEFFADYDRLPDQEGNSLELPAAPAIGCGGAIDRVSKRLL